jgi:hypothetical protein
MSAMDELIHYIGEHGSVQPHIVDHLLDAYAHELAEKQRAFDGPSMTMAGNRMVPLDLITALIDPEVSNG